MSLSGAQVFLHLHRDGGLVDDDDDDDDDVVISVILLTAAALVSLIQVIFPTCPPAWPWPGPSYPAARCQFQPFAQLAR